MSDIEDNIETDSLSLGGTVSYDDENIVWQGRPSQWVNLGAFLFWLFIWTLPALLYFYWNHEELNSKYYEYEAVYSSIILVLSILPPLMILWAWLDVFYQQTIVTRNKIIERRGITKIFSNEENCEISDIEDIKAPPAGILALVGLATLVLITKDMDQPVIIIKAIKDREELQNKLTPIWRKLRIERKGFFAG